MVNFNGQTTIQEVAAAFPGAIEGRTFVVTGATSGLGRTFAIFVANEGAGTVVLTGRSQEKLDEAVNEAKATARSKTNVIGLLLDLESEESVRRAANQITSGTLGIPKIDFLINNAGIFAVPYKKVNGYESQFYTMHLSHFLFTNLIISHLASPARIVSVSSGGYIHGPLRFDDINFKDGEEYDKFQAYGQAKTANILFAIELSKRFRSKGIEAFSLHPGLIMTNILSHLDLVAEGIQDPVTGKSWDTYPITPEQGAATYLHAALDPSLDGKGGAYLQDCQITEPLRAMTDEDSVRLWELSNKIYGELF